MPPQQRMRRALGALCPLCSTLALAAGPQYIISPSTTACFFVPPVYPPSTLCILQHHYLRSTSFPLHLYFPTSPPFPSEHTSADHKYLPLTVRWCIGVSKPSHQALSSTLPSSEQRHYLHTSYLDCIQTRNLPNIGHAMTCPLSAGEGPARGRLRRGSRCQSRSVIYVHTIRKWGYGNVVTRGHEGRIEER